MQKDNSLLVNKQVINQTIMATQAVKKLVSPSLAQLAHQLITPELSQLASQISKISEQIKSISNFVGSFSNTLRAKYIVGMNDSYKTFMTNMRIIDGHWVVIDHELFKILKTKTTQDEISETIVNFYTKDKYEKLDLLFDTINTFNIIPERIHILKSCMHILKSSSKKHAYNVVIPTFMAQATGIIEDDCYNILPKNIISMNDSKRKNVINALEYFDCSVLFYKMFDSAITEGLFKNINKSEYEKYKQECGNNRHKILHGDADFLKYGTKENMIRTCLDLYMLCFVKMFLKYSVENIEVTNAK